jgi:hypothetical protein
VKRIEGFEVVELGKPYREWIIPTDTLKPIISTIEVVDDSNLERRSLRDGRAAPLGAQQARGRRQH